MTKKISELTLKATPADDDEFEIQETGDGSSRKCTLLSIRDSLIDLDPEVQTTSGSSVDLTGIVSSAKRVTILLDGVSTSSTGNLELTLNSEATGYTSTVSLLSASAVATSTATTQFNLTAGSAAADSHSGIVTLILQDSTNNTWAVDSILSNANATEMSLSAGSKSTSSALSSVQLVASSGTFDAGAVSLMVE